MTTTFSKGMQVHLSLRSAGDHLEFLRPHDDDPRHVIESLDEQGTAILRLVGGKVSVSTSLLKPVEPTFRHAGCEHCVFLGRVEEDSPERYASAAQNLKDGTGKTPERKRCMYDLWFCAVSDCDDKGPPKYSVMARFGNKADEDFRDRLPLPTGRTLEVLWQAQRLAQLRGLWSYGK